MVIHHCQAHSLLSSCTAPSQGKGGGRKPTHTSPELQVMRSCLMTASLADEELSEERPHGSSHKPLMLCSKDYRVF